MSSDPQLEDKIEKTRKEGLQDGEITFMIYLNIFKSTLSNDETKQEILLDEKKVVENIVHENFSRFGKDDRINVNGLEKLLRHIGLSAFCQKNGADKI